VNAWAITTVMKTEQALQAHALVHQTGLSDKKIELPGRKIGPSGGKIGPPDRKIEPSDKTEPLDKIQLPGKTELSGRLKEPPKTNTRRPTVAQTNVYPGQSKERKIQHWLDPT
jgi:hypothetical protein